MFSRILCPALLVLISALEGGLWWLTGNPLPLFVSGLALGAGVQMAFANWIINRWENAYRKDVSSPVVRLLDLLKKDEDRPGPTLH